MQPLPPPSVAFVAPRAGETIGGSYRFVIRLANFRLKPTDGAPSVLGEGHLHFSMDGGRFDLPAYSGPSGMAAVKAGTQGRYSPAVAPFIVYANLPRGQHTLVVSLADNLHADLGVSATIRFAVGAHEDDD